MAGNMNTSGDRQAPIPMRHLGELPQDTTSEVHGGVESSDAAGHSVPAQEQAARSAANQQTDQSDRQPAGQADITRNADADNPEPPHSGPAHAPNAQVVGTHGGTDAAAGAQLSGSKGPASGATATEKDASGTAGGSAQGDARADTPGANPVGGTGLGSTASVSPARTGTGDSSASGTALSGNPRGGGPGTDTP